MMQNPMGQNPDFDMAFIHDRQAMSDPMSAAIQTPHDYGYIFDPHLSDVDYIFDPLQDSSMQNHEPGAFDLHSHDLILTSGVGTSSQGIQNYYDGGQQLASQRVLIPRQLPYLINGVETKLHQQLFGHFTRNLSQVLTISIGDNNPMCGVVIPLALRDRTIMDTILCLAGSHLLRFYQGEQRGKLLHLSSERTRLHDAAATAQAYRLQGLKSMPRGNDALVSAFAPDREVIFATSILLCLYEIVEGTSDNGWRNHLEAARQIITDAVEDASPEHEPPTPNETRENLVTEINPFLIEYFLYHDSLAAVTVPSLKLTKVQTADLVNHDPTMIGVQDGLSDFIARISALCGQAACSPLQPDGNIVAKAVIIWEDLANWKTHGGIATERKMIAEFYRWALFIWLFSIVYPDGKEDPRVQDAVQRIAGEMCNIKYGDSVMSCLLFPLFVIGSAAIRQEDRDVISAQFGRLTKWSKLGNVDLTFQVVKKIWADHDMGLPRSWDWVKLLETHGRYLLVT
jgi:hypothetical protein